MNQNLKRIRELGGYAVTLTREEGLPTMVKRGAGFFRRRFLGKRARYLPKKEVLEAQRQKAKGENLPLISVLVPLYNTPENYLRDLLDSLEGQTSPCWELCLADASDRDHPQVEEIVKSYQDSRIRYTRIENKGIAENTNQAAQLARGEYLALADHDDILAPHAIYMVQKAIQDQPGDFYYSDEALFSTSIQKPMVGHFKPDYAYDYLLCCNYICHLAVFRADLFREIGGERPECDGSQDHDLFLRLIEASGKAPVHIPHVLYYWRVHEGSTSGGVAAKEYVTQSAIKAISDHLERTGQKGRVEEGLFPSTYRVVWELEEEPLVSILIPNKDHIGELKKCLDSLRDNTNYKNWEGIIIENNSTDPLTFAYYHQLQDVYPNCRVVNYEGPFNFSAINNFGRKEAKGEYLLLLNNDVEAIDPDWLTEMVRQTSRPGVGCCGAMLYYPDDTIQHAGIITGLGGYAGHSHKYHKRGGSGYMFRAATVQDFSGVTAACLMVKASVYDEMGGLDEEFTVAFNDVDFCLRIRDAGYRVVWTPYATLYHYESKSRGSDEKDPAKLERFNGERKRLYDKHTREGILADPFYNPSLTKDREDFSESPDLRNLQEI